MKSRRYRYKLVGLLFLILFGLLCFLACRSLLIDGNRWTAEPTASPSPTPTGEGMLNFLWDEPSPVLPSETPSPESSATPEFSPVLAPDADAANSISSHFENDPEWVLISPDPAQKGNDVP